MIKAQNGDAVMENFTRHFVRIERGKWTCVRPGEFTASDGKAHTCRDWFYVHAGSELHGRGPRPIPLMSRTRQVY